MFHLSTLRTPRPPNALLTGILLAFICTFALALSATADVDKTVRWTKSPLKDAQGQSLPPAASYEVWLLPEGQAEYLAASVPDTTYTLRAQTGITYWLRVRGVSATGAKSQFSLYSNPYRAPDASPVPPGLQAGIGPAFPNPFNAQTTIAYQVPDGLPSTAPVTLEIFDVRGRRLRVIALEREPGAHEAQWDGRSDHGAPVPAGLYLARFSCGTYTASTKLALVP
jgi:hypothetical protein